MTEGRDRRPDVGYGRPQARRRTPPDDRPTLRSVGTFDVCSNGAVNSDLSCFLYTLQRPTEAVVFALLGRLSGVTMVISTRRQKHLFPLPLQLIYATVLCFAASASVRLVCELRREATSDRLIASAERPVTIIPLTRGLLSGGRVSLDSQKLRNSFPGIEKKIEIRDS